MLDHRFINNFRKYRFLLVELIKRDMFVKYKGSVLGIFWSFLNPLLQMIILVLVFGYFFGKDIPYFPIYVLTGRLLYSFFSSATKRAMTSIRGGASIMKKVYVPKYIYVLSSVFSELITLFISMIILLCVMIVINCPFRLVNLYALVPIFLLLVFTIGCGLILAPAYVYFKDMKYLYNVFTQLLMYGCAIFFPISILPAKFQTIFYLNPVFVAINGLRDSIIYGKIQPLDQTLFLAISAIVSLIIGVLIFYKTQDEFVLKI